MEDSPSLFREHPPNISRRLLTAAFHRDGDTWTRCTLESIGGLSADSSAKNFHEDIQSL